MRRSAAAALLCGMAAGAGADSAVGVAGVHYESPGLVAPSVIVVAPRGSGDEWRLRLVGWTLGAEWRRASGPARVLSIGAAVTPRYAHNSNALYRDGEKDPILSYRNATFELSAGLDHAGPRHRSSARVLVLHESVRGPGPESERRWRAPFVGAELAYARRRWRSEESFGARRHGWSAGGRLRVFTGTRTFVQAQATAAAGHRWRRLFVKGEATGAWGHGLDVVSAFLVGGSWDLSGPGALYGYRHAEFRIERGAVLNVGADVRLLRGLELGARSGRLAAPGLRKQGHALRLATRWHGASLQLGAAVPHDSLRAPGRRLTVFGSATVAAFGSPSPW